MNNVSVFLNTKVVDSGILTAVANGCLAPCRYLCEGKTILIEEENQQFTVHRVSSFHRHGTEHVSKSNQDLSASSRHWIKTTLAVALVSPGLLLGSVLKLLTYLSAGVRAEHRLIKASLTPIDRDVGRSRSNPIKSINELNQAFEEEFTADRLHRPTRFLTIYTIRTFSFSGIHNLSLNDEAVSSIRRLNPEAVIVSNIKADNALSALRSTASQRGSDKWHPTIIHRNGKEDEQIPSLLRRGLFPWSTKHYHVVFEV